MSGVLAREMPANAAYRPSNQVRDESPHVTRESGLQKRLAQGQLQLVL